METTLFRPLIIQNQYKNLELKNRIIMPPMDQYSAENGKATKWHLEHYSRCALGGVGLIIIESTAVMNKNAMISPQDLGLWEDSQIEGIANIVESCHKYGAKVAIQLNHAGRKSNASNELIAPSPIAFSNMPIPKELDKQGIENITMAFEKAAKRALEAGVDMIEIHAAHGYLLSSFLSPLSNKRDDEYGINKAKFLQDILESVKNITQGTIPLCIRVSASDWTNGGNEVNDMVNLLKPITNLFDIIDVSSGGVTADAKIPAYPGYQIHLAYNIKYALEKPTFGGGFITDATMANYIIKSGACDGVYIGRELLRNPFFALQASRELGDKIDFPMQYERAR